MKTLSGILLMVTFLIYSERQMFGQEKVIISAGVGFPELINIGIKYQILSQAKIGLSAGWWPNWKYSGKMLSFSGDFYYHFAGSSKFSDISPWYGRIGLNSTFEDMNDVMNWLYLYLRFGRDIYLNNKFGISIDAGINYDGEKTPPFSLSIGGCIFYRF